MVHGLQKKQIVQEKILPVNLLNLLWHNSVRLHIKPLLFFLLHLPLHFMRCLRHTLFFTSSSPLPFLIVKCIHLVRVHCHAGVLIDSQFEYLCGVFEFRAPECINLSIQALSYDVFWRENVAKTELKPAVKFASLNYPDGPYINSQYTQQEFLATGLTLPGEQGGAGCCR